MSSNDKCCDKCRHDRENACPKWAECLTEGPLCHEDEQCAAKRREGAVTWRRESIERPAIMLGTGTCGLGAGAGKTLTAVKAFLADNKIEADIVEVGCIGLCAVEPLMDVQLPGRTRVSFQNVTADTATGILEAAFAGDMSGDSLFGQFRNDAHEAFADVPFIDDNPFFARQTRWVLANCGLIDPANMEEYVFRGGYRALGKTLRQDVPRDVCDKVLASGLRGRGGGGFPTGRKWLFALDAPADSKYLICNADEGDPGAFMDRAVIEGDPHRLIEGLALASYAIGASKAYVYIRAEYPLAIKRLEVAIAQAQETGLLGYNILDSGFSLDIIIKKGAGAFVCGEETALIHSIEGKRGMPRPRPPFPAVEGLFGKPTVINNVETLANLPAILDRGPDEFASIGTEKSKGTKVFALSGKVELTGLVEVAMGTSIREIIFDIGGGVANGKTFKAVQIGGPSGGCIPDEELDTEIDYESLKLVGAMMGSGGLVVMDEDTCMVDLAKFFMDFIQRESCGKCIPCREGTKQLLLTLEQITTGRGVDSDVNRDALRRFRGVMNLNQLASVIKDTSLCGLGQTAPNPVLSTLRWFRHEYEAHIFERRCPAGACKELLRYSIDADKCKGCTLCIKKCPADAILGAAKSPHHILTDKCIGCGACMEACRFDAVLVD
jgi:NADH:ubiquinone oxidoreductase subunit F (NADH-binding)/Pyruvate/2-oxoacid:ferredoxin oxidoreductase delta subunit/(2Fe-2S) ferredoxin